VKSERPEHLHCRQTYTLVLELRDSLESARCAIVVLSAQEVQVEAATDGTECDSLVPQKPLLTVSL
jgi:hypothetical protein